MAGERDTNEHVGDVAEDDCEEEGVLNSHKYSDVLAALQAQNLSVLSSLPPAVKRRVKALKKLQLETTKLEAQFFQEVHEIEMKYHLKYTPFFEKRAAVVTGDHEPNEEECDFAEDDEEEDDEDIAEELKNKVKIDGETKPNNDSSAGKEEEEPANGIPYFWLTIFKNVSLLAEMVQDHDEPILKHLKDIKVVFRNEPVMGFNLEFHFEANEFFTNSVLTKEYDMKCTPDDDDPFSFEGPEIFKCRGCNINWNKGKNVTLKMIKKKQKHKSRGLVRTITKTIQNDSFFNFFSPVAIPEDVNGSDVDDETRTLLTNDFEIGHYIRERIVPRAVLYFTGEGIEEEEDYEEEDEDEEAEDESSDSDSKEKLNNKKPKQKGVPSQQQTAADCKQQ